jgi:predicted GIY-YIG superfamily endonuclease
MKLWYVYVIQSEIPRRKKGRTLPGFYYVGSTTDPSRRIRQHNGEIVGGARFTSKHRPWNPRALYGPYKNRKDAWWAERALKKGKRGASRCKWASSDSKWFRGIGPKHPWVQDRTWFKQRDSLLKKASEEELTSFIDLAEEVLRDTSLVDILVTKEEDALSFGLIHVDSEQDI